MTHAPIDIADVPRICRCGWIGTRSEMKSSHFYPQAYKNCCPQCFSDGPKTLAQLKADEAFTVRQIEEWSRKPMHVQAAFSNGLEARLKGIRRKIEALESDGVVTFCSQCGHAQVNHDGDIGCKGRTCLCTAGPLEAWPPMEVAA